MQASSTSIYSLQSRWCINWWTVHFSWQNNAIFRDGNIYILFHFYINVHVYAHPCCSGFPQVFHKVNCFPQFFHFFQLATLVHMELSSISKQFAKKWPFGLGLNWTWVHGTKSDSSQKKFEFDLCKIDLFK